MRSQGHLRDEDGAFGRKIAYVVGINQASFKSRVEILAIVPREDLVYDTIRAIKELQWDEQVLCIAWMCAIANSDGRIDDMEWDIIYKIYHKELQLPLRAILKTQNWLTKSFLF